MTNLRSFLPLASLICCFAACSGSSSGGGGPTGPQIAASVPAGAGGLTINMAGSWEIRNSQIVDTNSPNPDPAINGTVFVIDPTRVQTIGQLPVNPDQLTLLLGAPPEYYVNQVDGRTIFYGVIVDRRAAGDTRLEIAVAGGALDADTIAVEAYSSTQEQNDVEPIYVVSRYQLARVTPAVPSDLEGADADGASGADAELPSIESVLDSAFGRH